MKIVASLRALAVEGRDQYRRDARLRRAVLLMGLLLGLFALDRLALWSASLDARIEAAEDRHARTLRAASQPEWLERARTAAAASADWSAGLWSGESPGLAQAEAQTWLEQALREAEVPGGRVSVSPAVAIDEEGRILQIATEVSGRFDPRSFVELLTRIEGHRSFMAVERALLFGGQRPRFDLAVYLWVTVEDGNES